MKFRRGPEIIDAVQYDGSLALAFLRDYESVRTAGDGSGACEIVSPWWRIGDRACVTRADVGDWIIRHEKNGLHTCKPDLFQQTYEPVEPPGEPTHG